MQEKYMPLYRKYRPKTFHDLIGQENIVSAFTNALNMKRIAHAYLFCGPRGTGKTSSARILAKSLNCQKGSPLEPCGKCPACLDVMNSLSIDVIEIDAASNRSVEDTQAILEKIQYVPVNGRYKIYVIDEVHMLSDAAFNSLLKTLEEPPENVIFILATTEPQKVLDTIISRCQRFDFRRITSDDIVKRMQYIAEQEHINISKDALRTIAKNSQGGMRDALSLLDQISVLGGSREITADDVNDLLGRISYDKLYEIAVCIAEGASEKSVKLINEVYEKGNEPVQLLNNLTGYFRDLMIVKNCSDKELVFNMTRINEEIYDKNRALTDKFTISEIVQIIDRLAYYTAQTKDSSDKYLRLELCIIDLTNFKNLPSAENLLKRIEALESRLASGMPEAARTAAAPVSMPAARPAAQPQPRIEQSSGVNTGVQRPVQPPAYSSPAETKAETAAYSNSAAASGGSDMHNTWVSIIQSLSSATAKAYFQKAQPVELSENRILIAFSNDLFIKMADKNKKQALSEAAAAYLGIKNPNIEIILSSNIPKDIKPSAPVKTAGRTAAPAEVLSGAAPETAANKPAAAQEASAQTEISGFEEKDDLQKQEEAEYQNYMMNKTEALQKPEKQVPPPDIDASSQAEMVRNLFDGKFIN